MASYRTLINPVTVTPEALKMNETPFGNRFINVTGVQRPVRRFSNNACFLFTGQTVYCHLEQPAISVSGYNRKETKEHCIAIATFQYMFQRSMAVIGRALELKTLIYKFHNGHIPFSTRPQCTFLRLVLLKFAV
jgi:hypothetical protein